MEEINIKSNYDGLNLGVTLVKPTNKEEIKGIFQICHGMAEHRKRYIPFMEWLADKGYICIIHDHRGHGASIKEDEDLGYFYDERANAIVEDVYQITKYIKEQFPNYPIYLFGHSMGSLVVRNYIKQYDDTIDKLIVCGSPSENKMASIAIGITKCLIKIKGDHYRSEFIQHMAFSSYEKKFKEESPNSWVVSQKEAVELYDADPKCGFIFTTNGFLNLFTLMKNTYSTKNWVRKHLDLPILFIGGEEDPVIGNPLKFEKAQKFLKNVGYKNIQGKLYKGKRHELLNEDIKEQVYIDILNWVENKL